MTFPISDLFTGTDEAALSTYNTSWVLTSGAVAAIRISSNRAYSFLGSQAYYYNDPPPSANYSVFADIHVLSTGVTNSTAVAGRMTTGASTFYMVRLARISGSSANWQLFRFNSGTATQLGSNVSQAFAAGDVFNVELRMSGSNISAYVNGVLTIGPIADGSPLTAAGFAGLRSGDASTTTTGFHVDNFSAVSSEADTTPPILSVPTGSATGTATATVGATTNEGNGTLYAFVSTSATPPASATLKAGTGAAWAGSVAVSSTGAKTLNATGLSASTGYYSHVIHTDAAANDSNIVTTAQFTTSAAAATATTLTGPSGGQVSAASGAFTVGANGAITGTVTVTPSDGGGGGTFSPTSVAISSGTPTATFAYTAGSVGAKTISIADNGGLTDAASLTYTATLVSGTLTSSPLKNNTGAVLASVAFDAYVNNPTTGGLVVKKTGLTSNGSGVISFSDGAVVAATSYRVVWKRTDTGDEGLETLTGA